MTAPPQVDIEDLPSVWSLDAEINWLVPGLLPEAAITLLCGDSGTGKSTLALALAGAIAHGGPFLGSECGQRRVLYVDGENPLGVVHERLHRLGIPETEHLKIWGHWNQSPPEGPWSPSIRQFVERYQPLTIFDSLIAFHPGKEQDASETRRYFNSYRALAALGASVLLTHHTGKSEAARQYRGSSDIKAAVDQAFLLEALTDPAMGLGQLRLKPFKTRLALTESRKILVNNGRFIAAPEGNATAREAIEAIVIESPGLSQRKVVEKAQAAGLPKHTVEGVLKAGEREGWLRVDGTPGHHQYYLAELDVLEGEI